MSRAGTQIDSEILLVKFIVKIIHFFRRHSKLRTDKIVEVYFPDYEELYYHSFDFICIFYFMWSRKLLHKRLSLKIFNQEVPVKV